MVTTMGHKEEHTVLRVENLKKRFNGFELVIDELRLQKGRIYGLTGPNGSGKTTLLCLLNLLEKPDSGKLYFEGEPCLRSSSTQLRIRRKMAMVLENPYLFRKSVLRNVMYGLRVRGVHRRTAEASAHAALELVNMDSFSDGRAQDLSRGETQRVAIARAIAIHPVMLFLDEPFTNIDRAHVALVENLLKRLNRERTMTIVLTTHDLFQAYRMSEEVFSLVSGKVVKGSIENLHHGEVVRRDGSAFVRLEQEIEIQVSTEEEGEVHIVIPPEDIILSKEKLESSARNIMEGNIKSIEIEGSTVRVVCDARVEFVSLITKASFDCMGLTLGSRVFLIFKTTSVKVF
jgi:molybdopterin-binding protein